MTMFELRSLHRGSPARAHQSIAVDRLPGVIALSLPAAGQQGPWSILKLPSSECLGSALASVRLTPGQPGLEHFSGCGLRVCGMRQPATMAQPDSGTVIRMALSCRRLVPDDRGQSRPAAAWVLAATPHDKSMVASCHVILSHEVGSDRVGKPYRSEGNLRS